MTLRVWVVLAPVAVMVPLAGIVKPVALANHLICPPGVIFATGKPVIFEVSTIDAFVCSFETRKYLSVTGVMVSPKDVVLLPKVKAVPFAVIEPSIRWVAYPLSTELAVEKTSSI